MKRRCFLKNTKKNELIDLLARHLDRYEEILFAFAHGSFMENGPFRDLDVAVFLQPDIVPEINFRYEMQMASQIEKALDIPFSADVRVLNKAKLSFRYHALRGCLLLDRQPDARIDFTTKTAVRYLDIAPILRRHTREAFAIAAES